MKTKSVKSINQCKSVIQTTHDIVKPLIRAIAPNVVPVRHLNADKDADDHDHEVESNRRPVLVLNMLHDAA